MFHVGCSFIWFSVVSRMIGQDRLNLSRNLIYIEIVYWNVPTANYSDASESIGVIGVL